MRQMKNLWLAFALFVGSGSILFANGGAWLTGVPGTGNASASKNDRHTDVTIENETLKIDLHPKYAAVEVRYRMHNTGPKVQQDFFFPVERWGKNPDVDTDTKNADIGQYQISVEGKELKSTNVAGAKVESSETKKPRTNRKAPKRNKKPAKRTKKAPERRKKVMKRLQGHSGNKTCPRSSHGRNRSFPLSEIKRARWQFVTVRSTQRTTNQFQTTCT